MTDARKIHHMLLYGTLCAGEPAHERLGLHEALTFQGRRRVPGTLYDLGPYPGLVLGSGTAPAELYRIDDPAIIAHVDSYEGHDPGDPSASLFVRTVLAVPRHAHSAAASLDAWVYVFNGSVAGRPVIRQRAWPEHRRRRGAAARAVPGSRARRR